MLCKVTTTKLLRDCFHFSISALIQPPLIQSERFQIVSDVYDTGKKYLQMQRRTAIGYCWALGDMYTRNCLSYNLLIEANITNRIMLVVMMMMVIMTMMMMSRRMMMTTTDSDGGSGGGSAGDNDCDADGDPYFRPGQMCSWEPSRVFQCRDRHSRYLWSSPV